jgi:hypothetical protein
METASMTRILLICAALSLSACGVDTMSAAATAAAAKAQEGKDAKQAEERFKDKLEDANQALKDRADSDE